MLDKIEAFAEKHHIFPSEGTILAAVSGGADSVCLLAALLELKDKFGFSVAAAHFDHRLRGAESDRDALFVGRLCRDRNVTLYTGSADVGGYARENGLGVEEAARRLRYDFFYETGKKSGAVRIATAHTADDNAETILFHLTRGAGPEDSAAFRPSTATSSVRCLAVTREEVLFFLSGGL
jgi:tRNA(Ile)-lysidine synthase